MFDHDRIKKGSKIKVIQRIYGKSMNNLLFFKNTLGNFLFLKQSVNTSAKIMS
jgi:hypothetical protein